MEANEERLFIVLEEHMLRRYIYIINKYNLHHHCVKGFNNIQIGTSRRDIINRIKHRSILEEEYLKLKYFVQGYVKSNKSIKIYLSNSEGYIAHNYVCKLKKDFPEVQLIAIQHGVFSLTQIPKQSMRFLINKLIKTIFGIYPIGVGFGAKIVDKYIVYNDAYKNFLIKSSSWKEEDLIVDIEFIKAELYDKKRDDLKEKNSAVFLMQCLSKASLCSKEDEEYLNRVVVNYLSLKYEKVLIKEHPACLSKSNIKLNENCYFITDLVDGFNRSVHAYSFSSTTLLEAEIFDIETYAINSTIIGGDKSVYKIFKNVINFENQIDK